MSLSALDVYWLDVDGRSHTDVTSCDVMTSRERPSDVLMFSNDVTPSDVKLSDATPNDVTLSDVTPNDVTLSDVT